MITADEAIADYRASLTRAGETIAIRRYTGSGATRTPHDTDVLGRIVAYLPQELVGLVKQGDQKVIVFAPDLADAGFDEPILDSDKVYVRGRELSIQAVDDNTRRIGDTLIAYELQVRGA